MGRAGWRDCNNDVRWCNHCGLSFEAPPSRIAHVFRLHTGRCEAATPEERVVFVRTRRWPIRKKS